MSKRFMAYTHRNPPETMGNGSGAHSAHSLQIAGRTYTYEYSQIVVSPVRVGNSPVAKAPQNGPFPRASSGRNERLRATRALHGLFMALWDRFTAPKPPSVGREQKRRDGDRSGHVA